MSDSIEEQKDHDLEPQQELPGSRLKKAREAAGMACEDVAAQMRLNERMVKALEADDYSVFPSATFVSGYLRSYARILSLPEDDYVMPVGGNIEPPSIVSTIGSKAQVSSSDLPVRMVTWLLVIVVIVSVSMWWLSQREKGGGILQTAENEVARTDGKIDLSLPEQTTAGSAEQTQVNAEATETKAVAESTSLSEAPPAQDTSAETAQETVSTAAEEQAASTAEDSPKSADKAPSPPPLTAATPTSKLELRYQADSWTEVTDSAGRQLVYGLINAGQDLQLKGEAPFKVFLGYAPGVTVYYNNDLFDHSPFQRRDVARFRIGRAEHNLPGSR